MPTLTIPFAYTASMTLPGAGIRTSHPLRGKVTLTPGTVATDELVVAYRVYGRNGKARITEIRQLGDSFWCRFTQGWEGDYIRCLADFQHLLISHVELTGFGPAALGEHEPGQLHELPSLEEFKAVQGLASLPVDYEDDSATVTDGLRQVPVVILEADKRLTVWVPSAKPCYRVSTVKGLPVVVNAFWKDAPHPAFRSRVEFGCDELDTALARAAHKAQMIGGTDSSDVQLIRYIEAAHGAVESPLEETEEMAPLDEPIAA